MYVCKNTHIANYNYDTDWFVRQNTRIYSNNKYFIFHVYSKETHRQAVKTNIW